MVTHHLRAYMQRCSHNPQTHSPSFYILIIQDLSHWSDAKPLCEQNNRCYSMLMWDFNIYMQSIYPHMKCYQTTNNWPNDPLKSQDEFVGGNKCLQGKATLKHCEMEKSSNTTHKVRWRLNFHFVKTPHRLRMEGGCIVLWREKRTRREEQSQTGMSDHRDGHVCGRRSRRGIKGEVIMGKVWR